MNDQALVDLIIRVSDSGNALNCPPLSEVIRQINMVKDFTKFVNADGFREALTDAQEYRTMSDRRWGMERMLLTAVRHIGEKQGLTLRWEHPNKLNVLLIGTVDVVTHTGHQRVWCIRNVFEQKDVENHEYHDVLTNNVFHAISWRARAPRSISNLGWHDPIYINKPDNTAEVYVG